VAETENTEKINISFENEVAEAGPGVRQRALAVQALFELSRAFGDEPSEEQVERLRGLSKKEAKAARKVLEETVKLVFVEEVTSQEQYQNDDAGLSASDIEVEQPEQVQMVEVELTTPQGEIETSEGKNEVEVPVQIGERAKKWLLGMEAEVGDIELLTTASIPVIVKNLIDKYAPKKKVQLDYGYILEAYLLGVSYQDISVREGVPQSSIANLLSRLKRTILNANDSEHIIEEDTLKVGLVADSEPAQVNELEVALVKGEESTPEVSDIEEVEPQTEPVTEIKAEQAQDLVLTAKQRHEILERAAKSLEEVEEEEWLRIAETQIVELASIHIQEHQAVALWDHLHADEDEKYKKTTKNYMDAINRLRPQYRKVFEDRFNKNSLDRKILPQFFNSSTGWRNLDDLYDFLEQNTTDTWTLQYAQRQAVVTFSELLRP